MIRLQDLVMEYKYFIRPEDREKPADYLAVQYYQNGITVGDVQRYLRGMPLKRGKGAKYMAYIKEQVELIDSVIQSKGKPITTPLYRGVDERGFYKERAVDKGYASTSPELNDAVKSFGYGGIIMKLELEPGIKGLHMDSYLDSKDIDGAAQNEFLLPRGLTFTRTEEGKEYNSYLVSK